MADIRFFVLFNSITVISGWEGGNERLCEMESRLRLKRLSSPAKSNQGLLDHQRPVLHHVARRGSLSF